MFDLRAFLKEELTGWRRWEVAWLLTACGVILALSLYWHDTIMGIGSAPVRANRSSKT